MKSGIKILTLIFAILFSLNMTAQKYDCHEQGATPYKVTAKSGLTLRANPDINSDKLLAVPFGAEVMVCEYAWYAGTQDEIEGVPGQWVYTNFAEKSGYMFNGFLERQTAVKLVVPEWEMSDYSQFSDDSEWFAIYSTSDHDYLQKFDVEQCEPISHYVSLDEASYTPQIKGQPVFAVSGIPNINTKNLNGHAFTAKFLFPGQEFYINTDKGSYIVYAKGQLIKSKSEAEFRAYEGIKNYKLCVKSLKDGNMQNSTILKVDFLNLDPGYTVPLNAPVLKWLGDIDDDGELDMLLNRNLDMCSEYMLFLSSRAERGFISKQMARYMVCDGC